MKLRLMLLAMSVLVVMVISLALRVPSPVLAGGAIQISGIMYPTVPGDCTDPQGQGSSYSAKLTGDLEGCLYTFVETAACTPGGTYHESGSEVFVSSDESGTFETNYFFQAKYEDCQNLVGEIVGFCQHPLVDDSGTGVYAGVSGRLHVRDDIEAGNFPYTGQLQWLGSP